MTKEPEESTAQPENWTRNYFELLGVMPEDQDLLMVPPETAVADAIDLMRTHRFSQLPVSRDGRRAIGVFSHQSYANAVVDRARKAPGNRVFNPLSLTVGDCTVAIPRFANVHNAFTTWLDDVDAQGFALVAAHDRVQAMITPTDLLTYLHKVASPYMLVADCEFALRSIIQRVLSPDQLAEGATKCLKSKYLPERLPTRLIDMTLDDYESIITNGCWSHFEKVFGRNRENTRPTLERLVKTRNKLFHHRGDVTPLEHDDLISDREWLRVKVESLPREGTSR